LVDLIKNVLHQALRCKVTKKILLVSDGKCINDEYTGKTEQNEIFSFIPFALRLFLRQDTCVSLSFYHLVSVGTVKARLQSPTLSSYSPSPLSVSVIHPIDWNTFG